MKQLMPLVALLLSVAALLSGCTDDVRACDAEPELLRTADSVEFVRTPDSCFAGLPNWPYEPKYVEIDGLRQAYVEAGPADGEVVLLLHGQPSWSYLYRKMIPVLADAGFRVIAMDHLGMGRSDKPTDIASYSYLGHNKRLERFIEKLKLRDINLFVQDWGSTIGLRVAGLHPEWFARIIAGDGDLPVFPDGFEPFPPVKNPDEVAELPSLFTDVPAQQVPAYDGCKPLVEPEPGFFGVWIEYCLKAASFRPSEVVEAITWFDLPDDEEAAYDAPFPSRVYMAGPRVFPSLVNQMGGTTAEAWDRLQAFARPFLTIWAANDAGNLGQCETQDKLICNIKGAADQPHARLPNASHFLQDDQGEDIARRIVAWIEGDSSITGNHEATCADNGPTLPVANDGTGTACTTEKECSGLDAKLCLSQQGGTGFCTVEGCTAGSCAAPYLCCHDCNPAASGLLPFEGSACFPAAGTAQLTGGAGCTCD
jgi:haloalkane dehalogenase